MVWQNLMAGSGEDVPPCKPGQGKSAILRCSSPLHREVLPYVQHRTIILKMLPDLVPEDGRICQANGLRNFRDAANRLIPWTRLKWIHIVIPERLLSIMCARLLLQECLKELKSQPTLPDIEVSFSEPWATNHLPEPKNAPRRIMPAIKFPMLKNLSALDVMTSPIRLLAGKAKSIHFNLCERCRTGEEAAHQLEPVPLKIASINGYVGEDINMTALRRGEGVLDRHFDSQLKLRRAGGQYDLEGEAPWLSNKRRR